MANTIHGTILKMGAAAAMSLALVTPSMAQGYDSMSCNDLWFERNAIYADKGYCFKTARAKRAFGVRCYEPFGRLSRRETNIVADIKAAERRRGC